MKSLTEIVYESVFGEQPYKVAWRILDKVYEFTRADQREKNFGVKFDELGGNLTAHLWHYNTSMESLEKNGYVVKVSGGWKVLLWAKTQNNGDFCKEREPIGILIQDKRSNTKITDKHILDKTKEAGEKLKKRIILY